jgi:hypothetical protein
MKLKVQVLVTLCASLLVVTFSSQAHAQASAVLLNFTTLTAAKAALGAPFKWQLTVNNTAAVSNKIGTVVKLVAPDNTTCTLLNTTPTLIAGKITLASGSYVSTSCSPLTGTFTLKGMTTDLSNGGATVYETDIPVTISSVPTNKIYASIGGSGPASASIGATSDFQYVVANLGSSTLSLKVNTSVIDPTGKKTTVTTGTSTNYISGANTVTAGELTTTQYSTLTGTWTMEVDVVQGTSTVATDTYAFTRTALASTIVAPTFVDKATSSGLSGTRSNPTIPSCPPFQDQMLGGSGATIIDYDGDGLDDIFVTDWLGNNHLWHNNGNNTYTDVAASAGIPKQIQASSTAAADIDNDGHVDLVVLYDSMPTILLHNNGDGTFTDISANSGLNSNPVVQNNMSATFGDYDGDGFLDLYVTVHADCNASNQNDHLFHNNGNNTFTDVTNLLGGSTNPALNGRGLVVSFLDYNNDGRPDIYIGNDEGFQSYSHPNVLFRNDGSDGHGGWIFTDVSASTAANVAISAMGIAQTDYNRKGQFNMFATNVGNNVMLQLGSDGNFTQVEWDTPWYSRTARTSIPNPRKPGSQTLGITWAALAYDFNNDGWEDLYVAGGNLAAGTSIYPPAVFVNNQDGTFLELTPQSGTNKVAMSQVNAIASDFDNNGLMDFFTIGVTGTPHLFMNTTKTKNHWLEVKLVGTTSNKDGVGTHLVASVAGVNLLRQVVNGGGFLGNHTLVQHFGLGTATQVDTLTITWPDGKVQTMTNIPANQKITVTEN